LLDQLTKYNISLGRGFSTSTKKEDVASIDSKQGSSFLTFKQPTE
jgi:hypothetical protein